MRKNSTSIQINDRWEIRSDPYCWVLVEHVPIDQSHHKAKGNRETKEFHTYHSTVEHCCKTILNEVGKEGCTTGRELIEEWKKAQEDISKVFGENYATL